MGGSDDILTGLGARRGYGAPVIIDPPGAGRSALGAARTWWTAAARHRLPVLAGWTVLLSALHLSARGFGWHYFVTGARLLDSGHALHLFVLDPALQSGPLAFAAVLSLTALLPAHLAELVGMAAMAAAGLLVVWLLELLTRRSEAGVSPGRLLAIGLAVTGVWPELAVHWAHPDDVLALTALLGALLALAHGRAVAAAVLVGLAVDCKPWALLFVPLLLLGPRRTRLATAAACAVTVGAAWAPFVLADPATLAAVHFRIPVDRASLLHLVGVRGGTPSWCRYAQLVAGAGLVVVAVRRHRWHAALLVGVCARMALDPATKNYYDAGLTLAAAVFDAVAASAVPWLTLAAVGMVYLPSYLLGSLPIERALLRGVFLLGAPVLLLAGARARPARPTA